MTTAADNLQVIASQLEKLGGQLLNVIEQLPSVSSAMPEQDSHNASPEIAAAEAELKRLRADTEDARREYAGVTEMITSAEAKLAALQSELANLNSQAEAQRNLLDELRLETERLAQSSAEARRLAAQLPALQAQQHEAETKLDELFILKTELAESARKSEAARHLLEKLWPTWLLGGDLSTWKNEIEAGAYDPRAPASFGLLFAALHGYNAALRDTDPKALYDSIRDVGRRLYQWLEDRGQVQSAASGIAEIWAEAINGETAGRCSIQVAVPGNPAINQWMTFPPRGSSPEVVTVRTWCVFDAQRRPIHRAEVTV